MNKDGYLKALGGIIRNELPDEEYENVMQYYGEYFEDAGADREQEVIESLGTPENLAGCIIAEHRGKNPEEVVIRTKRRGLPLGWIITIAIVGSPFWLALLCVAIAFASCIISVTFAFAVVAAVLVIAGGVLVVGGIGKLFSGPGDGLAAIGVGFVVAAIGIGLVMLIMFIVSLIVKAVKRRNEKKTEGGSGQ